ncbi:DUF4326 domain-containing protein [Salmonella enterica subsp. enterica serovar Infantis]|nr:DUF4326 domain-containing protein [Salmonella enterica subsp. enterica serovar Infantis]
MLPFAPRTRVVNMRNGNNDYDVRIDRTTKWGNKFYMKKETVAERDRVCDCHKVDLWRKILNGDITLRELDALYGKKLGCWCWPKRCHGDAIVEAVEWAHALICKYERIKATYRKRKRGKGNRTKKVSKKGRRVA